MKIKIIVSFIAALCLVAGSSIWALEPGDIAVLGINGDLPTPDEAAILVLDDIPAGTVIKITDRGWDDNLAAFSGLGVPKSEGVITWTCSAQVDRGTIIKLAIPGTGGAVQTEPGVYANDMDTNGWTNLATQVFGGGGDQILIYQGDDANPTFIYGFTSAFQTSPKGDGNWHTPVTTANESALPPGLVPGQTAIALTGSLHADNLVYTGPFEGTKETILANLANSDNWTGNNETRNDLSPGGANFPEKFTVDKTTVILASFELEPDGNSVLVKWQSEKEVDLLGYNVLRSDSIDTDYHTVNSERIDATGSNTSGAAYSFLDNEVYDDIYFYKLEYVYNDGSTEFSHSIPVTIATNVTEKSLPKTFALRQNYPNPFNPSTVIQFDLPAHVDVHLDIYNAQGQFIKTLIDGYMAAGTHSVTWDRTNNNGAIVSSGTYFYSMRAGDFRALAKMISLK